MRLNMEEVQKQHKSTKKLYEQGLTAAPVDVKRVLDLYDTIEALQQEIEQHIKWNEAHTKARVEQAELIDKLLKDKDEQAGRLMQYDTVLKQARKALKTCEEIASSEKNQLFWTADVAQKSIKVIDALLGGKEE